MKTSKLFLGSALLLALATTAAFAAGTATTPEVTCEVAKIQLFSTDTAATISIVAGDAVAGTAISKMSVAGVYNATANAASKISAKLTGDSALVTAKYTLLVKLGEDPFVTIVTGATATEIDTLGPVVITNAAIQYKLQGESTSTVLTSGAVAVVFTITD